jgi:uncharacterized phage infection (PIP) family protein YhgE
METTIAFVLGMSVVVVITLLIVAVIGFFKAIKTEKALNEHIQIISTELDIRFDKINASLENYSNTAHQRIDEVLREKEKEHEALYRTIDEQIKECKSALIHNVEELHRKIQDLGEYSNRRMDDILSQMDSRLDKLETRLKTYVDNNAEMTKLALQTHKITLKD